MPDEDRDEARASYCSAGVEDVLAVLDAVRCDWLDYVASGIRLTRGQASESGRLQSLSKSFGRDVNMVSGGGLPQGNYMRVYGVSTGAEARAGDSGRSIAVGREARASEGGGAVTIGGGTGGTSGNGGAVTLVAGEGTGAGAGGSVQITGGRSGGGWSLLPVTSVLGYHLDCEAILERLRWYHGKNDQEQVRFVSFFVDDVPMLAFTASTLRSPYGAAGVAAGVKTDFGVAVPFLPSPGGPVGPCSRVWRGYAAGPNEARTIFGEALKAAAAAAWSEHPGWTDGRTERVC